MTIKAQIETGRSKICSYFMDEEGDVQQDRWRNKLNTPTFEGVLNPSPLFPFKALTPAETHAQLNLTEVKNGHNKFH